MSEYEQQTQNIIDDLKNKYIDKKTDYPTETITLPSRGYFYAIDDPLSNGKIELKQPTAREEDILTSRNLITKGIVLDKFLESIIVTKINYDNLLLGDKNGIMYAARVLTYGNEYGVELKCPSCGELNRKNIDLNNISIKDISFEEFQQNINEFSYTLPVSKKEIKFKLLTHADEKMIEQELKNMKKKTNVDTEMTTRLKFSIIEVNGKREKSEIFKLVESMPTKDSFALRSEIFRITPDMDSKFDFSCDECGYTEERDIPLGISFFWPSRRL